MDHYERLRLAVAETFRLAQASGHLFRTNANPSTMWHTYLQARAPHGDVQHHNCRACQQFIGRFGGLVTIDATGHQQSALWDRTRMRGLSYGSAVSALQTMVETAQVDGVFYSDERTLGDDSAAPARFTHLCAHLTDTVARPAAKMAEKQEEFILLARSIASFHTHHIGRAVTLLRSGLLVNASRTLPQAVWAQALKRWLNDMRDARARRNYMWRSVAKAPQGFTHIRSGMLGVLLEEIASDKSPQDIARAWGEKMAPDRYQRPQAAPAEYRIDRWD